jgi:cathepsin H
MGKFTFVVVIMIALAAGLHASEDLEVAWQDYLVKFKTLFLLNFMM